MGTPMEIRWSGLRASTRLGLVALAALSLLAPLPASLAKDRRADNVHRPDAPCLTCHTADRDTLNSNTLAARALLARDLETRCLVCHDEGPSHRTGMPPKRGVPDTLPLSADGLITCSTCHFPHGQPHPFDDLLRLDNSRGGLCLTCHDLSELK